MRTFRNCGDVTMPSLRVVVRELSTEGAWLAPLTAMVLWACEGEYRPYHPVMGISPKEPDSRSDAGVPTSPATSGAQSGVPMSIGDGTAGENPQGDTQCTPGSAVTGCAPRALCENDAGACDSTCPGCFIAGECIGRDALELENPCHVCDPDRNSRGWSDYDGVPCDDQRFCTVDDVCRSGACAGTARNCEDGISCNGVSTCLEEADACSVPVSNCGNNAICDTNTDTCKTACDGCVVSGVCVLAGSEAPGNPCLVCDPARLTSG